MLRVLPSFFSRLWYKCACALMRAVGRVGRAGSAAAQVPCAHISQAACHRSTASAGGRVSCTGDGSLAGRRRLAGTHLCGCGIVWLRLLQAAAAARSCSWFQRIPTTNSVVWWAIAADVWPVQLLAAAAATPIGDACPVTGCTGACAFAARRVQPTAVHASASETAVGFPQLSRKIG